LAKINSFVKERIGIDNICTAAHRLKRLQLNEYGACYDDLCLFETVDTIREETTKYIYKKVLNIDFDTFFLIKKGGAQINNDYFEKYVKYKGKYLALKMLLKNM